MYLFLISLKCEPTKDHTRIEGKQEIANKTPDMLLSVTKNTRKRLTQYMENGGHQPTILIFNN